MASFPASIHSFTTKNDGPGNTILAAHVNDLQSEVVAIETNLRSGSTGQVYVGSDPPAFSSVVSLHRVNSSQLSVSGASTLGTVQAGASTLTTLQAGASTLATLQAGNSTITGDLTVSGSIINAGISRLLKSTNWNSNSTSPTTLVSCTLSGLTAFDTLDVEFTMEAVTVDASSIALRSATDNVTIIDMNDQAGVGAFVAGREAGGTIKIRKINSANSVMAWQRAHTDNNAAINTGQRSNLTTPWVTDPWTLVLSFAGCSTTGGSFQGNISIYKKTG